MRSLLIALLITVTSSLHAQDITQDEFALWKQIYPQLNQVLKVHRDDIHFFMEDNYGFESAKYTQYQPDVITSWVISALKDTHLYYLYQPIAAGFNRDDEQRLLLVTHRLMQAVIIQLLGNSVERIDVEIAVTIEEIQQIQNDPALEQGYVNTVIPQYENALRVLKENRERIEQANQKDVALVAAEAESLMQFLAGA